MTSEAFDNDEFSGEDKPHRSDRIGDRIAGKAGKAEVGFLALLRYAALAIAALVLVTSVVFLGIGAYRQVGRTQVGPESVSVEVNDVIPVKVDTTASAPDVPQPKAGISAQIRSRTLAIYRARFKSYERPDTKVTEQQVVDFVWSEDRIAAFAGISTSGVLDAQGKALTGRDAVMTNALAVVEEAAKAEPFRKQLAAYDKATKVKVCTDKSRTRTRTVSAWDAYSTSCAGWYVSPVGCPSTRVVEEPYVEKVCEMKFPGDLETPAQQFANAVQRYADIAEARLATARIEADAETARNQARKLEGWENVVDSGKLFVGFLLVMFLYLFVAMERHHRNLRALMARRSDNPAG